MASNVWERPGGCSPEPILVAGKGAAEQAETAVVGSA